MQRICSKCGIFFEYTKGDNQYHNSNRLAPDTLRKLKDIISNVCFCPNCINKISNRSDMK